MSQDIDAVELGDGSNTESQLESFKLHFFVRDGHSAVQVQINWCHMCRLSLFEIIDGITPINTYSSSKMKKRHLLSITFLYLLSLASAEYPARVDVE